MAWSNSPIRWMCITSNNPFSIDAGSFSLHYLHIFFCSLNFLCPACNGHRALLNNWLFNSLFPRKFHALTLTDWMNDCSSNQLSFFHLEHCHYCQQQTNCIKGNLLRNWNRSNREGFWIYCTYARTACIQASTAAQQAAVQLLFFLFSARSRVIVRTFVPTYLSSPNAYVG